MTHFMDDTLKTRGIIYSNVETGLWFAVPYRNFWLRACHRCNRKSALVLLKKWHV